MTTLILDHRAAMRGATLLVGCYLGLSVLTLVAIVLLRGHPALVTPAVWVRAVIVVATASLMTSFAVHAARGSNRAYRRLRIASAVMVVAIAVIIAIPGTFPMWMKVEQAACGLILLGVVILVNSTQMRSLFAR